MQNRNSLKNNAHLKSNRGNFWKINFCRNNRNWSKNKITKMMSYDDYDEEGRLAGGVDTGVYLDKDEEQGNKDIFGVIFQCCRKHRRTLWTTMV